MLCEKCKQREATGYMEKTINGVKTRIHVCPQCFKNAQMEMFNEDDFGLFFGLMGSINSVGKCSKCGTSFHNISATGYMGCPNCYSEMEEQLKPVIRNIQSAVKHIGAVPGGENDEIVELERQLKRAVDSENYELAMELSARIKEIKGGSR